MVKIAPSVLSADLWRLSEQIEQIERSEAEWLHLDIMDGCFVPNISYGPALLRAIRPHSRLFFDTHLMVLDPDKYLQPFAEAGADLLTVHAEVCTHLHRTVQNIKALEKRAGVALNPATPLCLVEEVLPELDLVLLMSVNPGFGGQKFISSVLSKARRLRELREQNGLSFEIEIDGGVTMENTAEIVKNGATVLVSGNTLFGAKDIAGAVRKMKQLAGE